MGHAVHGWAVLLAVSGFSHAKAHYHSCFDRQYQPASPDFLVCVALGEAAGKFKHLATVFIIVEAHEKRKQIFSLGIEGGGADRSGDRFCFCCAARLGHRVGKLIVETADIDAKRTVDGEQSAGADPVGAVLVLLYFLECNPDRLAKRGLRYAKPRAPRTNPFPDLRVSFVGAPPGAKGRAWPFSLWRSDSAYPLSHSSYLPDWWSGSVAR